jgi:hypothetical protein
MDLLREFVEALGEIAQSALDRRHLLRQPLDVAARRHVPEMQSSAHRSLGAASDFAADAHRHGGDVCESFTSHR